MREAFYYFNEPKNIQVGLRKLTLLDLRERNVNHIIPSYCHLPVSYRSLRDRCGSLGSCKPQTYFYYFVLLIAARFAK